MNITQQSINNISRLYVVALKNIGIKIDDNLKKNFISVFENLISRYTETHRMFHTIDHISYVLNNLKTAKPEAVLAAIYHDSIYVPGATQNEYCSAQLAARHLSLLGVKTNTIFNVSKHILSTEQHVPIDLDGNEELLDADMMILASKKSVFNEYCYNLRLEFPYLSDSEFTSQRSRWALECLGRKQIFYSKKHSKLENIARKNLRTLTKI
jgi:predicted metal-dependent HD superfamily phosphohydrolase